jgi:hypothetical protein
MSLDPRRYDLDELRAASGMETGGTDGERPTELPGGRIATLAATTEAGAGSELAPEPDPDPDPDPDPGTPAPDPSTPAAGTDRPAAAVAFESAVARDLAARDAANPVDERPYLPDLPESFTAEALLFEWLDFLVRQAGREAAAGALSFYERIGWVGADAAARLETYLSGLNEPGVGEDGELDVDDHRVSLHYVARLAALRG